MTASDKIRHIVRTMQQQFIGLIIGGLFTGIGLVTVLVSADTIPTPDAAFGAPRWITGLVGTAFLAFGIMILSSIASAFIRRPWTEASARIIATAGMAIMFVSLLTAGTAFLVLKFVNPEGATGVVLLFGVPLPLPEWAKEFTVRAAILFCLAAMGLGGVLALWAFIEQQKAARRDRRR